MRKEWDEAHKDNSISSTDKRTSEKDEPRNQEIYSQVYITSSG